MTTPVLEPKACRSCGLPIPRPRVGKFGRFPLCCRFWLKVEVRGLDECWPWKAQRMRDGHGVISAPGDAGRPLLAHRVAYELAGHQIPAGLVVMHRCDVPYCVNPDHLAVGTQAENIADMFAKGRNRTRALKGEHNPSAILTEEKVQRIRRLYATGRYTQHELAGEIGITRAAVCDVVRRKSWRHVA